MATRNYQRQGGTLGEVVAEELGAMLDAALGFVGTEVTLGITPTLIIVSHPSLTEANDVAVNAVLVGYVHDPLFGLIAEAKKLRGAVATLRQWATDATATAAQLDTEVAAWDAQTTAQRFAALKQVLQGLSTLTTRLGALADRLADVLTVQDLN